MMDKPDCRFLCAFGGVLFWVFLCEDGQAHVMFLCVCMCSVLRLLCEDGQRPYSILLRLDVRCCVSFSVWKSFLSLFM